jgi:hypothetical protein
MWPTSFLPRFDPSALAPATQELLILWRGSSTQQLKGGRTLSTPWDLNSVDLSGTLANGVIDPLGLYQGLAVSKDGRRALVAQRAYNNIVIQRILQCYMSTAWDPTTITYSGVYAPAPLLIGELAQLSASPDGTQVFMVDRSVSRKVMQLVLSSGWDLSDYEVESTPLVPAPFTGYEIAGMDVSTDGTKLLMICNTSTGIGLMRYDMSVPWSLPSATLHSSGTVLPDLTNPRALRFEPDGSMFVTMHLGMLRAFALAAPWDVTQTATLIAEEAYTNGFLTFDFWLSR